MKAGHAPERDVVACRFTRDQQGPNALRPLPEARTAGRIRRRGKRLQADRRQPIQRSRAALVEDWSRRRDRHQMLLQKQPLARLPRFEGLQPRSRLTKKHETHPTDTEDLDIA